ncbi:MAG: ATP-binding protein [Bacteroidetes bacterium]|nr:ATP-binding protein [Bacteroidota bacterium]
MEIPRFIEQELIAHLEKEEITLLIGPRQAGKTTLLKDIAGKLEREGKNCLFFNLDIDADAQHFVTQQKLVDRITALTGGKRTYVFIDEVQRIENAGLFLKGIFDRKLVHKWIASGSGSLELKEKIAESLAGRKRNFLLYPVSIAEFLSYRLSIGISQCIPLLQTDALLEENMLFEYLQYGGYPRVITEQDPLEKRKILQEIFESYVERDLQSLLQIEKKRELITLLQLIAYRIGRLVNYQDLSNMSNLSVPTVKKYLWYCQKTFIIDEVLPYFSNKAKELTKTPQCYFVDLGFRNYLLDAFNVSEHAPDFSFLFQQLIFQLLQNRFANGISSIRYWRTQNQAEVDFVVQNGLTLLPVEVKAAPMRRPEITRSMRSFLDAYKPKEAWIINRQLKDTLLVDNTEVKFLPWYELLV